MRAKKVYRAIGLMSGTSLDGIDAALIETDGYGFVKPLAFVSQPYEEGLRERLRACFGQSDVDKDIQQEMTLAHAAIVKKLGEDADVVGFHGQTILHNPSPGGGVQVRDGEELRRGGELRGGVTVQMGDGSLLAAETGIDVVCDFRSADVAAGGQGAPFLPLYHQALAVAAGLELPVAIQNIGGVGNVTWIGFPHCSPRESGDLDGSDGKVPTVAGTADFYEILAFDTGPGNALIDDFVKARMGARYDEDGSLARSGSFSQDILHNSISLGYFDKGAPKSLDRDAWEEIVSAVENLSDADGAASLTEFTVQSIVRAQEHFPAPVQAWYITGGGRHNGFMMERLGEVLGAPVRSVDALGWNGDGLEAEGFAYLAVRSLLGEPLSVPGTTGVKEPMTGGVLCRASESGSIAV